MKNRDFALNERVATVIAQIACHENSLPQGSPCSPVISNMVANVLDMRLVKLASAAGCTYSRYADDLTFSTNLREFPAEIATMSDPAEGDEQRWRPGRQLVREITGAGFRINDAKTRLMYRRSRQRVTGLVVNQKVNVRREYRHTVRAMVHKLVTTGAFETYRAAGDVGSMSVTKQAGSLDELHGMLGFVDTLDVHNNPARARREREDECKGDNSSTERVYRDFLLYRNFYAATTPVVLCEGETDNIYLTHAIRSLASEFPSLAEIRDGKTHLRIRLYKYPRSSTARILELNDGGSGVLTKFINMYRRHTSRFAPPAQSYPVIILYDNDSGAKSIRSTIKQITKMTVTGVEQFVHVIQNLYALPVPLIGAAQESAIEDCFNEETKAITIDGKAFNTASRIDTEKHYGKQVFAKQVVKARAHMIDFTGFRPLLASLVAVIDAHKTGVTS
jgi:hypothetical protein